MGVKDLWKILSPAGEVRDFPEFVMTEGFQSESRGMMRLAVDISHWLWQAQSVFLVKHSQNGENPELRMIFRRLVWLFTTGVQVIFVFDGPNRPQYKRNKLVLSKDHWLTPKTQELITAFGYHWYTAPGEAEAELAHLNRIGAVDAIVTDDGDAFLFGALCVMRNPNIKRDGKNVTIYQSIPISHDPEIALTRGGMVLIALLRGGDYDSVGVDGCGITIAHGIARSGLGDTLLAAAQALSSTALPPFLVEWRKELCLQLATDPENHIGRRHPILSKKVPAVFPNPHVLTAYASPITSWSDGNVGPNLQLFPSREPDIPRLAAFCSLTFGWSDATITTQFERYIWPGSFCHMLLKSNGVYDLIRREHINVFNASSVLDIVKFKITRASLKLYYIKTSTTLLCHAAESVLKQKPSRASFSHMWIASAILEAALPEMVSEFAKQITTKVRTPSGRRRNATILANRKASLTIVPAKSDDLPQQRVVQDAKDSTNHEIINLALNDFEPLERRKDVVPINNLQRPQSNGVTHDVIDLTLDDWEPPIVDSSTFWTGGPILRAT